MAVRARLTGFVAALLALVSPMGGAWASGGGEPEPWYLDQYGGDMLDVHAWMDGRLGIVMPTAPRSMRFVDWRLLHGLKVGRAAGDPLAMPCCSRQYWEWNSHKGSSGWRETRKSITGLSDAGFLISDRSGPDDESLPNCLDDAFDTATATLKARAQRYGAKSPAVRAWVAAQDAVFQACSTPNVALPPPLANAPTWLDKDRAYQQGALALYDGRWEDAAVAFETIARDPGSPWKSYGQYLAARALMHEAFAAKTTDAYAKARSVVGTLANTPGARGRDQAAGMIDALDFRQRPAELLIRRERELAAPAPDPRLAIQFRDYSDLGAGAGPKPEALDWIDTIRANPPAIDYGPSAPKAEDGVTRQEIARRAALANALQSWRSRHDVAWLAAAISLVSPDDPQAAELAAAADRIPASSPAYVDLLHHRIRLGLARAPAAETRRRIDTLMAGRRLSVSDRNVFASQRLQVSANLKDFARFALRQRLCAGSIGYYDRGPPECVRQRWLEDDFQRGGVFDGARSKGTTGLGADARALIDRAPLAFRIALSRDTALPARIRLDIALTSWARAVQLQDNTAIDGLSRELEPLLPLMAPEFRAIATARPGADKRFAEFLVLAKVPGIRVDLADDSYIRPEGRRVVDFQQYWTDWVILRRPATGQTPPPLVTYQTMGAGYDGYYPDRAWPDRLTDLACLGECGRGSSPLRTPDFLARDAAKATAERAWFFKTDHDYDKAAPAMPPDAVAAWDEMLTYIAAHPKDPRAPEALYWLIEVGHFGGTHNHSGKRAFLLLHHRYEGTVWARKAKYYND